MSDAPSPITVGPVPVETILDLRHAVLRPGLPRDAANFDGDGEPTTVHLAAFDESRPGRPVVGCATLVHRPWNERAAAQLRGMAVHPDYQRNGVGRLLLAAFDRAAADAGLDLLWANCRTPAVPFYRKLGWHLASEQFEIPTAGPHYKMTKRLTPGNEDGKQQGFRRFCR